MTDLDDIPGLFIPTTEPVVSAPRKCRRHEWYLSERKRYSSTGELLPPKNPDGWARCIRCGKVRDEVVSRRGRTNRTRGNREELTVARAIGGRKVGPLGHPWDVEMGGYARLQVKKLKNPPSLRAIGESLTFGTGEMMAGFIWVEPGRGGEQLIVFRLKDFAARHGVPEVDE